MADVMGLLLIGNAPDVAPPVRPPTVAEAVEWLKNMQHSPEYCRTCLTHWKRVMGASAARQVFEQAPESVRKWINERKA